MSIFRFPLDDYNPYTLSKKYTPAQVRKEYSRLRSIAQKRITRLVNVNLWTDGKIENARQRFGVLKSFDNDRQVRAALTDVKRFLRTMGSTVTGQKKQRADYIDYAKNEWGVTWVNESNYLEVRRFFELVAEKQNEAGITSPKAVEYLVSLKSAPKNITAKRLYRGFVKWLDLEENFRNQRRYSD